MKKTLLIFWALFIMVLSIMNANALTKQIEYKKGVLNKKGETVVPIEYDDIKVNETESEYVCFKKGKEVKRIHFK